MNISSYNSIPNGIFAYWLSLNAIRNFSREYIGDHFISREGMVTSDNDLFLRYWFEIDLGKACFNATDSIYAVYTGKKWFPYNKGGNYRRWYGNNEYLINWYLDGKEIKTNIDPKTNKIRSHNYNDSYGFLEGITWSKISTGQFSARFCESGFLFDTAGTKMFRKEKDDVGYLYCLSYINSKVSQFYLNTISPTLNNKPGDILLLPLLVAEKEKIEARCRQNLDLAKIDWNVFEISWDFKKHPLI